ncbi:MAG: dihydropteroate synthase [Tannerella sp.]|jgi:dihydropteroate synthase|nr:dihydropteroate synthase [Tannerella sp.]
MKTKLLNIKGKLMSLDRPVVMGILNATPDSFYAKSRQTNEYEVKKRIETVIEEGATFIDIGGYSTRPTAALVSEEEEWRRLKPVLEILSTGYSKIPVSVDTFRAKIAWRAVEDYGAAIINDISGGTLDEKMFETVADLNVPYILMHIKGTPRTMHECEYYVNILEEVMLYFSEKLKKLRRMGVNDVIVDPGFGFSKNVNQNYYLMSRLKEFSEMMDCLVLVGVSRKRMIFKFLEISSEESLTGTTVLNTFALLNGADILRVHDVKAAVEAIKIVDKLIN